MAKTKRQPGRPRIIRQPPTRRRQSSVRSWSPSAGATDGAACLVPCDRRSPSQGTHASIGVQVPKCTPSVAEPFEHAGRIEVRIRECRVQLERTTIRSACSVVPTDILQRFPEQHPCLRTGWAVRVFSCALQRTLERVDGTFGLVGNDMDLAEFDPRRRVVRMRAHVRLEQPAGTPELPSVTSGNEPRPGRNPRDRAAGGGMVELEEQLARPGLERPVGIDENDRPADQAESLRRAGEPERTSDPRRRPSARPHPCAHLGHLAPAKPVAPAISRRGEPSPSHIPPNRGGRHAAQPSDVRGRETTTRHSVRIHLRPRRSAAVSVLGPISRPRRACPSSP